MPANAAHRAQIGNSIADRNLEDSELCKQILEVDPATRVAVILEGNQISGFASSARIANPLSQTDFREKMGYWMRIVTEIGRQNEQLFGGLDSITFMHGKLKLVTIPLTATRSLGLSLEKSTNPDMLMTKIRSSINLTP